MITLVILFPRLPPPLPFKAYAHYGVKGIDVI
jgi:hypothetical protein